VIAFARPFTVDRPGPGSVRLNADGVAIVLEGVESERLPASMPGLEIEEAVQGERRLLTLRSGADVYQVAARHWRIHESVPDLFAASLSRFVPSKGERRAARLLVATAALPGAARLYRLWHAWRSR
jgi:hypothetical protein